VEAFTLLWIIVGSYNPRSQHNFKPEFIDGHIESWTNGDISVHRFKGGWWSDPNKDIYVRMNGVGLKPMPLRKLFSDHPLTYDKNRILNTWSKGTFKSNLRKRITVGDQVVDGYGHRGIVVKIIVGYDSSNHGIINVWQLDQMDYGADNCEHYCYTNWRDHLRIVKRNPPRP
jgi:hypothetical protein